MTKKMRVQILGQKQFKRKVVKIVCSYFLVTGIIGLILTSILHSMNLKYRDELVSIAEAINDSKLINEIDTKSNINNLYSDINDIILEIYYQYMIYGPIKQVYENKVENGGEAAKEAANKINWSTTDEIDVAVTKLCNKIENIEYVHEDLVFTLPFLRNAIDNKDKLELTEAELIAINNSDKSEDIFLSKMTAITAEMGTIEPSKVSMRLLVSATLLDITTIVIVMSLMALPLILIFILLFKEVWKDRKIIVMNKNG